MELIPNLESLENWSILLLCSFDYIQTVSNDALYKKKPEFCRVEVQNVIFFYGRTLCWSNIPQYRVPILSNAFFVYSVFNGTVYFFDIFFNPMGTFWKGFGGEFLNWAISQMGCNTCYLVLLLQIEVTFASLCI